MTNSEGKQFWEGVYQAASPTSSGRPGKLLCELASPLPPGRALELGCAKGDDAVWLAREGWQVLAVDISAVALNYAAANARAARVADRIQFEQHDLAQTFPNGRFDLVTASFLYSPTGDFTRIQILKRAAEAVAPGGHLLIVDHGSRAPWSWAPVDTVYATAQQSLAMLELPAGQWTPVRVEEVERAAIGPAGETATVVDNVLFVRRHQPGQRD